MTYILFFKFLYDDRGHGFDGLGLGWIRMVWRGVCLPGIQMCSESCILSGSFPNMPYVLFELIRQLLLVSCSSNFVFVQCGACFFR